MTIKLVVLKSGEDIISDVSEMTFGEGEDLRVVGYYLSKPCVVKLIKPTMKQDNMGIDVSLYPWMPFSSDEKIPIPSDWLVTMVEPINTLKEMYIEDVLNYEKDGKDGKDRESFSVDEQSDSDQSD